MNNPSHTLLPKFQGSALVLSVAATILATKLPAVESYGASTLPRSHILLLGPELGKLVRNRRRKPQVCL